MKRIPAKATCAAVMCLILWSWHSGVAVLADPPAASAENGAATQPTTETKEPWVSKPVKDWPLLHLTNAIELTKNRRMEGATAELVELPDGTIIAATARHLLGPLGGIDPPLKLAEVNSSIVSWTLHCRTEALGIVRLGKLLTSLDDEGKHDCLAMTVLTKRNNLPSFPLKARTTPIKIGDRVSLIGVPYSEPTATQNVYSGVVKVIYLAGVAEFTFDGGIGVETRGFSGAPVIDENGYFAGVFLGHVDKGADLKSHTVHFLMSTEFLDTLAKKAK